ncbi:hypothetical protein K435DRAFT_853392 [Dendrothele bispora CBS 962.96]|uniref:Uncharacterized protein n=1 Tax=Dendrothele bispora (strain CBS 962.96) TaxID=1314807 RepID=A0A4S8MGN9_DENBC|nr:hypothetical protein K435DRAFT_853392 [Dendrothele bispora CBS 962.96]
MSRPSSTTEDTPPSYMTSLSEISYHDRAHQTRPLFKMNNVVRTTMTSLRTKKPIAVPVMHFLFHSTSLKSAGTYRTGYSGQTHAHTSRGRVGSFSPSLIPKGVVDRMRELGVKAGNWKETRKERKNEEHRTTLKRLDTKTLENGGIHLKLGLGSSFVRGLGTRGGFSPNLVGKGHDGTTGNSSGPETQGEASASKKWLPELRNISMNVGCSWKPNERKLPELETLTLFAEEDCSVPSLATDNRQGVLDRHYDLDDEKRVDEETWRMETIHEREEFFNDVANSLPCFSENEPESGHVYG